MSRPMLLVFLLLVLIITSQFEWKQQLVPDVDSNPTISEKQRQISKREETIKEKVLKFSALILIPSFKNFFVDLISGLGCVIF